jgi:hypothetical protein
MHLLKRQGLKDATSLRRFPDTKLIELLGQMLSQSGAPQSRIPSYWPVRMVEFKFLHGVSQAQETVAGAETPPR